jgi:carbon-monoxide dehydrogenase small subunit
MDATGSQSVAVRLDVNGDEHVVDTTADRRLIDVLRDDLGLTGTKEGCAVGVCGLCSVLVDGQLMSACLVPAVSADGSTVETVEGLASAGGELTPLQEAFVRDGGYQCGICTPGQLIAATALLRERTHPSTAEIREWMTGNLCRCTGYEGIVRAIGSVVSAAGS